MQIEVTQAHIDNGTPWEPGSCPIALAVNDMGYSNSTVDRRSGEAQDREGVNFAWDMPEEASKFTADFDSRKNVEPFIFGVELYYIDKFGYAKLHDCDEFGCDINCTDSGKPIEYDEGSA